MKNLNNYLNKVCVVSWLDACGEQKEDLSKLDSVSPSSLLVHTETFGEIYKIDDNAIVILQEKSAEQVDYTCIPINWIEDIKILR
jgi:hypothetical protein